MTNKEKAEEILKVSNTKEACGILDEEDVIVNYPSLEAALSEDLMQMAQWKDEQFAKEKAALINRLFQEFEFENFTYVDIDGNLDFDDYKFSAFLERVSGVKITE